MKKVIALLLTMVMLVFIVGCGKSAGSDTPATNDVNNENEAKEPEETVSEPVDLTMWCIAVESDSNRHAYETAIADFQAAHPEINLTWETTQNQEYKTKIKAAVAANEMPDIFFAWGGGFLREFVEAGRVYCLDDVCADYASELPDKLLANHTYDGKCYAIPTNYNVVAMFANMEILKQAGFDKVPGTYEELIACCDALVANGSIPFGCSGKETWCVTEYLESIIEKSVGASMLSDMYLGKASWNNEGVIEAVNKFQDMINKKYFDPEGIALSDNEIKENYKAGKYAFYINGTWNCADFCNAGMEDKIQIAEFPVIDTSKSSLGELIGGPNDSLAVAASSKNPEVAAKTVFELTKGICHYGYLDGNGLPVWTPDYPTDSLNKLTLAVAEIIDNSNQIVMYGDCIQSADNANIYLDYVSQIYSSAIDGKTFAEKLDSDLKN